ncbi:hypothetical protein M408DRAFT_327884, partial [Serendipita vermifera MAFF 305830]
MKYFSFRVNGVVQGVNFRDWAKKIATSNQISGYIRNASEGHVEGEAFGPAQSMDDFKTLLHRGPRHAEVTSVDISDEKAVESAEEIGWKLNRFEIRR